MSILWKTLAGFIGLLLLGAVLLLWLFWSWSQPLSSEPVETSRFIVPKGQAIQIIGQRLAEEGYIKHPFAFRLAVRQDNLANRLQAGSFEISPSMSVAEIAHQLTQGTDDVWITVVEGWRIEEIADMLERQELEAYDRDEFISLAANQEGELFPDTYLLPRLATSQTIYTLLTDTFEKKVTLGLADEIEAVPYTMNEILTMASIVEREAKGYEQSRIVAGILWNRIDLGIPLQVDATLQYIKGYDANQDTWWPEPYAADKERVSPYNTYQNPGLPPAPISNPGLDAIRATLNPVATDNLYYIHDAQGRIHPAETLDQHNANIDRYLR